MSTYILYKGTGETHLATFEEQADALKDFVKTIEENAKELIKNAYEAISLDVLLKWIDEHYNKGFVGKWGVPFLENKINAEVCCLGVPNLKRLTVHLPEMSFTITNKEDDDINRLIGFEI